MQATAIAGCLDDVTGQPIDLTTRIDLAESLATNGTPANEADTTVVAPQVIATTVTRASCFVGLNYQNVAEAVFHFSPIVSGSPTLTVQNSSQTVSPAPGQCTAPTPPGGGGGPPGGCATAHAPNANDAAIKPNAHCCNC
jgi:hypothetical protein